MVYPRVKKISFLAFYFTLLYLLELSNVYCLLLMCIQCSFNIKCAQANLYTIREQWLFIKYTLYIQSFTLYSMSTLNILTPLLKSHTPNLEMLKIVIPCTMLLIKLYLRFSQVIKLLLSRKKSSQMTADIVEKTFHFCCLFSLIINLNMLFKQLIDRYCIR